MSNEYTPVEERNGFYFKRDDFFQIAGVRGGKVRTCHYLAEKYVLNGRRGLVTASARTSPQAVIVASIARHFDMKARIHMPSGEYSPEMVQVEELGGEIIQHKAGYNTVIIARARDDAWDHNYGLIPFGMECREAVTQTEKQVFNIPKEIKTIVVAVGSGMSLCGILSGLNSYQRHSIKVKGIVVGADPNKRLMTYAPWGSWRRITFINAGIPYNKIPDETVFQTINLDPYYEAKCIKFLEKGDLFWLVGIRGVYGENSTERFSVNTKESIPGTFK